MSTQTRQARICAWAFAYQHQVNPWAVVDTETTGMGDRDEVIEVSIVSPAGVILFSSLIQPQNPHRADLATHIHGITRDMLAGAPTFPDVWPSIETLLLAHPQILAYNAPFDSRLLMATAQRYGYRLPQAQWSCLMEQYAVYHGAWQSYHQSYTWQKLVTACTCLGVQVQGDTHRSTADALSTLGVLHALADRYQPPVEEVHA